MRRLHSSLPIRVRRAERRRLSVNRSGRTTAMRVCHRARSPRRSAQSCYRRHPSGATFVRKSATGGEPPELEVGLVLRVLDDPEPAGRRAQALHLERDLEGCELVCDPAKKDSKSSGLYGIRGREPGRSATSRVIVRRRPLLRRLGHPAPIRPSNIRRCFSSSVLAEMPDSRSCGQVVRESQVTRQRVRSVAGNFQNGESGVDALPTRRVDESNPSTRCLCQLAARTGSEFRGTCSRAGRFDAVGRNWTCVNRPRFRTPVVMTRSKQGGSQDASSRSRQEQRGILYLSQHDIAAIAPADEDLLGLTRAALVEHGAKRVEMPAKTAVHTRPDAFCHAMPAWVPALDASGCKWITCYPANVELGLPQTAGLLVLNDPHTGLPLAIMDAGWITARRTAAVSTLIAELLAPDDSEILAIIGCGVQGRAHAEMMPRRLHKLREVKLFDIRPGAAADCANLLNRQGATHTTVGASAEEIVRSADIIVTATAITVEPRPIVQDEWLKPCLLGLPIDLDSAWEWRTLARADKFIVDSLAEMQYFEGLGYLANGLPSLHGETGEILAGLRPAREPGDQLIISMNIGMGVVDVVIGRALFELACARQVGQLLTP